MQQIADLGNFTSNLILVKSLCDPAFFLRKKTTCSCFSPLHKSLIKTANREEPFFASVAEHDADYMLGVTSEATRDSSSADRVSKDVDEAVIVTSGDKLSIGRSGDSVDMGSISALGVDAVHVPSKLDRLRVPVSTRGVRTSVLVLSTVLSRKEEQFVGAAVRANIRTVLTPVQSHDV